MFILKEGNNFKNFIWDLWYLRLINVYSNEESLPRCYNFDNSQFGLKGDIKIGVLKTDRIGTDFVKFLGESLKRNKFDLVFMQHCDWNAESISAFDELCWPYKLYFKKGKTNFANALIFGSKWRLIAVEMDEAGRIVLMRLNSPKMTFNILNVDVIVDNPRLVREFISKNIEHFMKDEIVFIGGYFGLSLKNRKEGGLDKFLQKHNFTDLTDFMADGKSKKLEKKKLLIKSGQVDKFLRPFLSSEKVYDCWMLKAELKWEVRDDNFEIWEKKILNSEEKKKFLDEKDGMFFRLDKARKNNLIINPKGMYADPRYNSRDFAEEAKKKNENDIKDAFGNKVSIRPNSNQCGECPFNYGIKKLKWHYGMEHSPLTCFSCENHTYSCKGSRAMLDHMKTVHFPSWNGRCKFCVLAGEKKIKEMSSFSAYFYYLEHMRSKHGDVYNCLLSCKIGTESEVWRDQDARKYHLSMAHLIDAKELNDATFKVLNLDLRYLCVKCGSKNYFTEFAKVEKEIVDRDFSWKDLGVEEEFYRFAKKGEKVRVCKNCKEAEKARKKYEENKSKGKPPKTRNDFFTIFGKNYGKFEGLVYGLHNEPLALKNAWRLIETAPVDFYNPAHVGKYPYVSGELRLRMKESSWPLFACILGFLSLDKDLRRKVFQFSEDIEVFIKKYLEGFYLIWDLNFAYRDFYQKMLESGGLKVSRSMTAYELAGVVSKFFMYDLMTYFYENNTASALNEENSFLKIASFIQVRDNQLFVRRGPNHFVDIKNEFLLYKSRLWTWMFVELFLLDKGDMLEYLSKNEAENEKKLKSHMAQYSKELLKCGLDVFQLCPEFVLALYERYRAHQKVAGGIAFRSNLNVTAKEFKEMENDKFMYEVYDSKVRGSGGYFKKNMLKLTALNAKYGCPDFFLTLSFDEKSWVELEQIIGPSRFISGMPVNMVMHIIKRFGIINSDFLKLYSKLEGMMGTVKCYFSRMEMQDRGTLHFHMLIWVEEKEKGISLIRGNWPNKTAERMLAHLVKSRQIHVCDESCKTTNQNMTICKYFYPRRSGVYHVNYNSDLEMFEYPCPSMQDSYVVPYLSLLLLFCKSGMDIKIFQEKNKRQMIRYLTKYITKKKEVKKITTPEAVVGIIGTKHIRESEEIVSIPSGRDDEISKPLKSARKIKEISKTDPQSKDLYYDSKHEIYMSRPDELENYSYGEYFQLFEYSYAKRAQEGGMQDRRGRWIYRCKEEKAVMTSLSSTQNLNKQAYMMLKLFYPHRREADLLDVDDRELTNEEVYRYFETYKWADFYRTKIWLNPDLKERMERTNIYKFLQLIKEVVLRRRSDVDSMKATRMIDEMDAMFEDKKEELDLSDMQRKLEKFDKMFMKCSEEQKKLVSAISVYLEDYFLNRDSGHGIAVQGAAGTGKSYVIKLVRKLCKIMELVCEVVTPTGISALNVNGKTYHSYLSLAKGELKKIKTLEYARVKLKPEDKIRLMKTDVIVIEEMSMIGHKGLRAINLCLQAASLEFGVSHLFGGKCVIMFGDFMQLPPVKQKMTYLAESYSYFTQKYNLQDNQRAKEDPVFQFVLEKIREGNIDDHVERILLDREFDADKVTDKDIIYLYGKRIHAETRNQNMIEDLEGKCEIAYVFETPSFEEIRQQYKKPEWEEIYQRKLIGPRKLYLHRDCRYVLMKNMDNEFVNGTIVGVDWSKNVDKLEFVEIYLLKNPENRRVLKRYKQWIKFKHEGGKVSMHANQFPLTPAFAMTIHKVQGMTLDRVAVDLGSEDIFANHQAYVALSRVRHLNDLFILNYDREAFMRDEEVVEEIKTFMPAILIENVELPSKILGHINESDAQVVLDLARDRHLDMIIKLQVPLVNNSLEMFCNDPTNFTDTDMLIGKQDPKILAEVKEEIRAVKELITKQYNEFSKRDNAVIQEMINKVRPKKPVYYRYKGKRDRKKEPDERQGPPEFVQKIYEGALQRKYQSVLDQLRKDMESKVVPQIQMKSVNNEIDPWIITQITTPHKVQPFKYFKDKKDPEEQKETESFKKKKVDDMADLVKDLGKIKIQQPITIPFPSRVIREKTPPKITVIEEVKESPADMMDIEEPQVRPAYDDLLMDTEELEVANLTGLLQSMDYRAVIGLDNLGSTCYLNALLQVLASLGIATRNSLLNEVFINLRSSLNVSRELLQHVINSIPYAKQHYEQGMEGESYHLLNYLFEKDIIDYKNFDNKFIIMCTDNHMSEESDTHINIGTRKSVLEFFQEAKTCPYPDCNLPIAQTLYGFCKYLIVLRPLWLFQDGVEVRNNNPTRIDNHFVFDNKHFMFKGAVCWRGPHDNTGHFYAKIYHNYRIIELSDRNRKEIFGEKYLDWNLAFYEIIPYSIN